jgi:hypothetical protein
MGDFCNLEVEVVDEERMGHRQCVCVCVGGEVVVVSVSLTD